MREVEASDIALRGVMVTQDQLRKKDREVRRGFSSVTDELQLQSRRIERKVDACAEGEIKQLLAGWVKLGEQVAEVGEALEGQDRHMQEELQGAERRWERHVNQQEERLEAKIEEKEERLDAKMEEMETRLQSKERESAERMEMLSARVDDAISKIAEESLKAPWERRVQEASLGWRKELEDVSLGWRKDLEAALVARPTREELSAYTTLVTTEKVITQLANLQIRTNEQLNGLQGGLYTVERLTLRQVDQRADMVSVPNEDQNPLIKYFQVDVPEKLREVLTSREAEDRARRVEAPKWAPAAGRILKGLPRRARATSGPPDSPTRPGPSRITAGTEGETADVEMEDGAAGQGKDFYHSLGVPFTDTSSIARGAW
jgi:hypothetical protein